MGALGPGQVVLERPEERAPGVKCRPGPLATSHHHSLPTLPVFCLG